MPFFIINQSFWTLKLLIFFIEKSNERCVIIGNFSQNWGKIALQKVFFPGDFGLLPTVHSWEEEGRSSAVAVGINDL